MLQKYNHLSRFVPRAPLKMGEFTDHAVATLKNWNKTREHLDVSKRFT
jgi:hypothetical protein